MDVANLSIKNKKIWEIYSSESICEKLFYQVF